MKITRTVFLWLALLLALPAVAQKTSGYVILVEGNDIYVDLTENDVKAGDLLDVIGEAEYIIHPVTKKRIPKEAVSAGTLRVTVPHAEYSLAACDDKVLQARLKAGMKVEKQVRLAGSNPSAQTAKTAVKPAVSAPSSARVPVMITPTEVNDITGIGYFGLYVSDMLMEKLMRNDRITLLDRSILEAQMNEIDLAGRYIDAATAIEKGRIKGARYAIQVTMQKPDVVNVKTGVPLASVMGALQGLTGTNLGAQYFSNTRVERLKSAVDITARVIDMQTSEVVFMCSGSGHAEGKVQLGLEYGALGGTQVNGGINGFKQTVTGQAINEAFDFIANGLNRFFNGETTERVLSNAGSKPLGEGMLLASKGRLYMDTDRLGDEDLQSLFVNNPDYYFRYKKARKLRTLSCLPVIWFSGGLICAAVGAGGSRPDITVTTGVLMMLSGGTATYLMLWKSNKELHALANGYNRSKQQERGYGGALSLVGTPGGVGLRLTF